MNSRTKTDKKIKENKKGDKPIKIRIGVDDIMPILIQRIMNEYGVEWEDIEYKGKTKCLHFEISAYDKNLCNNVMPAFDGGGCGSTTGGCICGLPAGHKGRHECKRCGEEWESNDD